MLGGLRARENFAAAPLSPPGRRRPRGRPAPSRDITGGNARCCVTEQGAVCWGTAGFLLPRLKKKPRGVRYKDFLIGKQLVAGIPIYFISHWCSLKYSRVIEWETFRLRQRNAVTEQAVQLRAACRPPGALN